MPYLKGKSLEELLQNNRKLPLRYVLHLGLQIVSGLAQAHEMGLIHRDIKLSNLWLEPVGGDRIKILDFELARSHEDDISLTQSGVILGTPAYMAPEQAKGEKVDARADLYSLGVVLYRMASGQLPLSASDTYSMLVALATEQPRPIQELAPELPPLLADLIMRLLAKDPRQRPGSAREVTRELRNIIATVNIAGPFPSSSPAFSSDHRVLPLAQPVPAPAAEPETVNNPWAILTTTDTSTPPTASQTQRRPCRSYPNFTLLVALGIATLATLMLIGVIVVIRDKSGREIARIEIDHGNSVEIRDGGRTVQVWPKGEPKSQGSIAGDIRSKAPSAKGGKDPDRQAALWVISAGGRIRVRLSGEHDDITPTTNLPAEPFEVREIYLSRNPHVNDQDLARLAELQSLAVLHLTGTKITDAGLFHLKHLKSLRRLELVDCYHISDGGLGHLKELTNLDHLWLYATPISDEGLIHIKQLKNLTSLNVGYTKVTEEGLEHILELKNLTFLHIGGDKITDTGLARLKKLRMLKYLDINGNPITDTGLSYLKELPDLEWVNLAETPITDAGLIHLKDIKKLTRLEFRKNKELSDAGLIHLGELRQLTGLILDLPTITDKGLAHLKDLKELTFLSLEGTRITDSGLIAWGSLKSVENLNLSNTNITGRSLAWIGSQLGSKHIALVNTRISREGYESLKRTHPQWANHLHWSERNHELAQTVLRIGGQVWIARRDEVEAKLVTSSEELMRDYFQVRRISLTNLRQPLGNIPEMLAQLSDPNWDRLEALNMTGQPVPNLGFLRGITTLTELGLTEANLSDPILSQFPRLPKLKKLVLDGNEMGTAGVGHLVAAVPQVEELSLARTLCDTPTVLQLTGLKELRVLSLAGTAVNDNTVRELARLSRLESLDLRNTKVSAKGITELRKALPKCRILWEGTK